MTQQIFNSDGLKKIILENNVSIEFLTAFISDVKYHDSKWNYDNLLHKFDYSKSYYSSNDVFQTPTYFDLLTLDFSTLSKYRNVGKVNLSKLNDFLAKHNCYIGMFHSFTISDFNSAFELPVQLSALTNHEKTLSLRILKSIVNSTGNDSDLGKEIRKIFNKLIV